MERLAVSALLALVFGLTGLVSASADDARRACDLMKARIASTGEIAANAIFLTGPLHVGLVDELEAASRAAPQAMVVISSPGGSGTDVEAISRALDLERRHVVISGPCLSACASHFVPRAAKVSACDDAFIGLHGAYTRQQFSQFDVPREGRPTFDSIVDEIMRAEERLQVEAGLDPTFFECIGEVTKPLPPYYNIDNPDATPRPVDERKFDRRPDYWAPPAYDLRAAGYPRIEDYPNRSEEVQNRAMRALADQGLPARVWQPGDEDSSRMVVTIDTRDRIALERQGVCRPVMTG